MPSTMLSMMSTMPHFVMPVRNQSGQRQSQAQVQRQVPLDTQQTLPTSQPPRLQMTRQQSDALIAAQGLQQLSVSGNYGNNNQHTQQRVVAVPIQNAQGTHGVYPVLNSALYMGDRVERQTANQSRANQNTAQSQSVSQQTNVRTQSRPLVVPLATANVRHPGIPPHMLATHALDRRVLAAQLADEQMRNARSVGMRLPIVIEPGERMPYEITPITTESAQPGRPSVVSVVPGSNTSSGTHSCMTGGDD